MSAQSTIMAADQCEVVYEASMHQLSLQRRSQHQLLVLLSLHQLLLLPNLLHGAFVPVDTRLLPVSGAKIRRSMLVDSVGRHAKAMDSMSRQSGLVDSAVQNE